MLCGCLLTVRNGRLCAWIPKWGPLTGSFLLNADLLSENWCFGATYRCTCFIYSSSTWGVTSAAMEKRWEYSQPAGGPGPRLPTWSTEIFTSHSLMPEFCGVRDKVCCLLRHPIVCRNPQIFIKVCGLQLCACVCLCFLGNLCCTLSPNDCFYCMRFLLLGTSLLTMITTTSTANAPLLYN